MNNGDLNWITNYIWGIADDILRDLYVRGKYRDVILPMTVLRRLDAVLEDNKRNVLERKASLDQHRVVEQDAALRQAAGQAFYNCSPFTLRDLRARSNPQQLKADFEAWLDGFSPNVQDILESFEFRNQISRLTKADALGALIEKLTSPDINLSPDPVMDSDGEVRKPGLDNHGMGTVFEELVRRFNEENNEEAGEHWTPRDAVRLMARLVFEPVADELESGTYLLYDGACGTGGMLTVAEETLKRLATEHGKQISTHLYGQEINAETYAICKADLLLKGEGEAADNIVGGPEHSTLANDAYPAREFDFMLSNPPYGKSWKTDLERMGGKSGMRDPRFLIEHANDPEYSLVTRSSDGQMLFLANKLSKMKQHTRLGSRIAEVHNGSSLFTGDAGQGESNIRRWIIENDWLEAIVALPLNLFYNTGIATYVWVLTNRKPEHRRGMVQLIDATGWHRPLRKNLGKKNCELSEADIDRICETFLAFEENEQSKIFENADFGYWKVTIERPLRIEGIEPNRAYKAAEIKKLKEKGKRSEDAPRVIRKIHKRGTDPDLLRGLSVAMLDGNPAVVEYEPDPDLRDTEQIPLTEEGGIEAFLRREVLPYAKDAWYKADTVKIGYEISFNRYFYKPQPMRTLEEIRADILALQAEADSLLPDFILRETKGEYVTRLRIYVDTSVIGGCHDEEYQELSQMLLDRFRNGSAVLVFSELLHRELLRAPQAVRDTFEQLPDDAKEMIDLTDEASRLADAYIEAGAIGSAHRTDARHIALATCARVDVLASWNFKHMVSEFRLRAYNRVNLRMGHTELRISSPEEIHRAEQSPRTI